eukprot:TRINITY_DN7146_c2_g1_i1.p2 TRINITY_DN7146_c2_g1~~TRINITY_DN7146_c2_g1_i1.p2  ORF type:complete len:103 (-),score=1.47 TRINITY_DN7146_c2_g1_i1:297-605(-)
MRRQFVITPYTNPSRHHKSNENIEVEKWPTAYHNRSDSCVLTHTRTHYKHWSRYKSKRTNLIIQGPNIQHLTRDYNQRCMWMHNLKSWIISFPSSSRNVNSS